ncbi:MAG: UDP-N-acetylmuramate dehydrogenase [Clostridiales bacterium]|nr:UDP-N-acetylmuramate dehydrogenase [Clostridiales bacterium]
MTEQFLTELKTIIEKNRIFEKEPMKKHTTFRVGGPADVLIQPEKDELSKILKLCRKQGEPYCVIGNGSNLLVGDKGIRGLVIEMVSKKEEIVITGETLRVGAGVMLSKTANEAAEAGLTGMEFAAGIPGTLGGAVVMNAGAYGGEMKDILVSVTVMDENGETREIKVQDLELGYRKSNILKNHYVVIEAVLRLAKGEKAAIREKMNTLKEQRREKQPLEYPSAGSTFKRPEGYFAGKLIMDAGLKGYQVGGAKISEKHCGFVINCGDAKASDIRRLIQEVSEEVEKQFGVTLEPEVKMIGEF